MGRAAGPDGGYPPMKGYEGGYVARGAGVCQGGYRSKVSREEDQVQGAEADKPRAYRANPARPPWRKVLTFRGSPRTRTIRCWWRCTEITSTTMMGRT